MAIKAFPRSHHREFAVAAPPSPPPLAPWWARSISSSSFLPPVWALPHGTLSGPAHKGGAGKKNEMKGGTSAQDLYKVLKDKDEEMERLRNQLKDLEGGGGKEILEKKRKRKKTPAAMCRWKGCEKNYQSTEKYKLCRRHGNLNRDTGELNLKDNSEYACR